MDDDIVINLATDDFVAPRKTSAQKGGRWTDRLKAKRDYIERPEKRARTDKSSQPTSSSKPTAATAKPTQIISSLFTSNPTIETPKPAPIPKASSSKPSNAPVDSSTFEGLGLSPLLISHLSSKMGIQKPTGIQRSALPLMLPTPSNTDIRDIFLQSQTGSGKTLSFLLPIIQDLLPLSSLSYIDRSIGTLAIIIAPTRELAKQISDVLEALLKMRLRAEGELEGSRMTRWIVSGLLIGGENRTHEKTRLRKGLPILVSTPGRLLDHIQNTASFNCAKCRWLVLDEADQLMDLGFEETITGILKGLDARRRLAIRAIEEGKSTEVGGWDWERPRRTVLCSATIRESVQKLAGTALTAASSTSLTPPSQLTQKYVVAPLKLRLIIVFLSCTDSVDFHFNLLGSAQMGAEGTAPESEEDDSDEEDEEESEEGGDEPKRKPTKLADDAVEAKCPLLPDVAIFRLHGSLPTHTRMRALKGFAGGKDGKDKKKTTTESQPTPTSSILFCTSVAARGLDLPLVRAVVQYDLPTEGGATEYVHRIGRTARAGKGGEAWSIVAPSESEWAKWVVDKMVGEGVGLEDMKEKEREREKIDLRQVPIDSVLQSGFGGKGKEFEMRATEVQLAFERWVLRNSENVGLARKAYLSHMRAYATHPSNEKHMFHIRHLHLGHLAKSFALREAPTKVNAASNSKSKSSKSTGSSKWAEVKARSESNKVNRAKAGKKGKQTNYDSDVDSDMDLAENEKRMKAVVRAQGRLSRKGGVMARTDTSEFQIMGTDYLEKLVSGR
ncbi:DEAD-domain-containing protein [Coprinellus micaceus]|uniref:ATP-dependent RNA helicase n=1 Tax=Coprinellus micaceus TaxID=71717 RepID=A0A4Y7TSZ5_COPMI|nr:DEAD-domain-containing protein [Coprinellus micaceus]